METRQKTEYRFFILNLADMHGGVNKAEAVAVFDDIEKLKSFYNSQLADEPWEDEPSMDFYGRVHSWHKVFKKGSVLEWHNPLSNYSFEVMSYQDSAFGGVTEEWAERGFSQTDWSIPLNPS